MADDPHPYLSSLKEITEGFVPAWEELRTLRAICGRIYYARIAMDNAAVQAALREIDNLYADRRGN